jgi:hypothetical protein
MGIWHKNDSVPTYTEKWEFLIRLKNAKITIFGLYTVLCNLDAVLLDAYDSTIVRERTGPKYNF